MDHSRLIQKDGAQYLIEYLEMKLGRTPAPAAGNFAEELFVKLRRPHGMTMSTWCSQVREAYRRLQRALKRARIERGEVSLPVASSSSTPKDLRLGLHQLDQLEEALMRQCRNLKPKKLPVELDKRLQMVKVEKIHLYYRSSAKGKGKEDGKELMIRLPHQIKRQHNEHGRLWIKDFPKYFLPSCWVG